MNDTHRAALAAVIESGPTPAIHGVVRWRIVDLCQWLHDQFGVTIAEQTLSRELRAMNYRKLSARPRQWPCGERPMARWPRGARPYSRVMFVLSHVSSKNTSRRASSLDFSLSHRRRASAMSQRVRSAASTHFFLTSGRAGATY